MHIPYQHSENIKLNQHVKDPTATQIDARQVVLILVPEKPGKAVWDRLAYADVLKPRYQQLQRQPGDHHRLVTDLPNKHGTRVILQVMDHDASTFEYLTSARELAKAAGSRNPATLLLQITGFPAATAARLLDAMTAALLASVCPMPSFKSDADKPAALRQIDIYGLDEKVDLAPVQAEAAGNHLARWLAALPPNELINTDHLPEICQATGHQGRLDHEVPRLKSTGS